MARDLIPPLELTLYTFHYLKDVDHVVLVLPPAPPGTRASASPSATPTPTPAATKPRPTVGLGATAAAAASRQTPLRALPTLTQLLAPTIKKPGGRAAAPGPGSGPPGSAGTSRTPGRAATAGTG